MHVSLDVLIPGIVLSLMEASAAAGVETAVLSGFNLSIPQKRKRNYFLFHVLVAEAQRTTLGSVRFWVWR